MAKLTEIQTKIKRYMDICTDIVVAYAAPEVPALGNATPEGLLEELGRINRVKKEVEKVEKILKERISVVSDGAKKIDSDNFIYTKSGQARVALDQTAAKAYFEKEGLLADFMKETEVETVRIKER